jgi:TRAP-type C4-dicarboxylate transport system permease large subunit
LGVIYAQNMEDLQHYPAASYTIVVLTCIFICAFASTWGPVAWVIVGEIYPLKARAKGMSVATASNWLLNWLIGLLTPQLTDTLHMGVKIAFIWGFFAVLMNIWVFFVVPETKGKSLEEIDALFEGKEKSQA